MPCFGLTLVKGAQASRGACASGGAGTHRVGRGAEACAGAGTPSCVPCRGRCAAGETRRGAPEPPGPGACGSRERVRRLVFGAQDSTPGAFLGLYL